MMELAAFRELVRTNHGAVLQYLRSLGCMRDVADRLTEETFLDVFRAGLPTELELSVQARLAAFQAQPEQHAKGAEEDDAVDTTITELLRQYFHPEPPSLALRIVARAEELAKAKKDSS